MGTSLFTDPDALPQLIGEFRPVDIWQAHINRIFYGLQGGRLREYYQTFASADYRLAHALATDYFQKVVQRDRARGERAHSSPLPRAPSHMPSGTSPTPRASSLIIQEWGAGNGNLAACFLTHLKHLDKEELVYPRVRYVLVEDQEAALKTALTHPDLAEHRARVETLCADVTDLGAVKDRTVDCILCNELWNDLPAKLMLRKEGEVEEEFIRPNLSEGKYAAIGDWSGFVKAFTDLDIQALRSFPTFLEDIIWEKEYRKIERKDVPFRKTLTEFLEQVDDHVLVPVNLGTFAALKEAKRVLVPDAVGLSSFDAGTAELRVLNDPDKPCYGQYGGQFSFMVNFALMEAVATHLGARSVTIESQREYVGRTLGTNVISLMDLLAAYPSPKSLQPWEQDRLILKTMRALGESYHSPYQRRIEFPLRKETPPEEREALQAILLSLKRDGVPDTVAYITESEVFEVIVELENLGYDRELIKAVLTAPPQGIEYCHFFCC
jgi:hypothetical protein